MGNVIEIHQKRFFSLEQARTLLPIIRRVTRNAFDQVKHLTTQLSYVKEKPQRDDLEKRIQELFQEWQEKVRKLGCEAKGMWLVDFDSGEGYYCWHYPEPNIEYFHGYFDGFRGRVRIH